MVITSQSVDGKTPVNSLQFMLSCFSALRNEQREPVDEEGRRCHRCLFTRFTHPTVIFTLVRGHVRRGVRVRGQEHAAPLSAE